MPCCPSVPSAPCTIASRCFDAFLDDADDDDVILIYLKDEDNGISSDAYVAVSDIDCINCDGLSATVVVGEGLPTLDFATDGSSIVLDTRKIGAFVNLG